ncbi:PEP/pyruvate-binding domain-containing protein [Phocaeicola coprocola]|uniref:PEP/pyruvate-binding domain-containing protein n=1 Tax=Phocaeicola coprocola TaxID=310298 RepID=UPI001C390FCB|nr:PEP/pyruvate-binding domain-containing protein [Phocaeicola coprocola]MBV3866179.1 phosphoenolpyruvate synthase [Phocaeicola coprocola]MBV4007362.1 phosphoenolpyruvate synthase [Phocaeicola coprocola]MBV4031789.1 phosphoenolpyruvate synthase [Phocaeicola coprocola]MBV4038375.1 phosphoenolpyruvate synthase [Phocaeicola coprocola]MBV4060010.1 phosphoenolpyruvate synthase [Phocaeicola coprocola]
MLSKLKLNQLYFKDTQFVSLMTKRIFNVLLVANPYDAFMLEDDGRIDEKIFIEYMNLSLRYPPRFTQVSTEEDAWKQLGNTMFDLVICMPGSDNSDTFDIARQIKEKYPHIPLVVLTPFSHGIKERMEHEDLSIFEYVFCWLGNTDLLVSIIKLIEDKMNLEHDIKEVGVQMILLVEDSIRFYSSVLPNLYKFVLRQSQEFATEALNEHQRTLRMRGRPKIVLARSYEEAMDLYNKYQNNTLGIISDARYPREGKIDPHAGIRFLTEVRSRDPFIPLILQSAEVSNKEFALSCGAQFIDKNSKKMNIDLREAVSENFGFGDFIFRNPNTMEEVVRVHNLKELQNAIFSIPAESFLYHISRNHISRWLYSRAIFPVAEFLKQITWESLQDIDAHRQIIFEAIVKYRKMKNQGVVAVFQRDRFDRYSNFARIGDGSLGGKGRGLAFIDNMVKRHAEFEEFENASVVIPKTVVLCTDIFDEFMDMNQLYQVALSDADDETILRAFLRAKLPDRLVEDFFAFFDVVKSPIAIRSSSLLEDSHYQPFAGIYSTYMIPYLTDKYEMLRMLSDAIKGVYASVYYKDSKAYMQATSNVIDQEKMAVILQEVVGTQYGDRFYPSISGVARSINYYPINDELAEEGTVSLALGLGKYIVDGGLTLRVCPYHPDKVLQTSEMEMALRETQTHFYALDLKNMGQNFSLDDGFNLLKLPVKEAENDGSLNYIASTYDPYDMVIRDGIYPGGRKVITFANILQHDVFPLARILQLVQKYGQGEMRRPVEIEFAVNLNAAEKKGVFYLLQIRPMVDMKADLNEDLDAIPEEQLLLKSVNSLGQGIMDDIQDVIYVKTEGYSASNNQLIAYDIEKLNKRFLDEGKHYILIGPGRWGSSDTWLGIPVKWPNISAARVIVEAGLTNYRVDPSQGTHFFQNLTSFGVGYFTINAYMNDGLYNQELLNSMPAVEETKYLRWVHFDKPLAVKMNGKKKIGVVSFD